MLLLALLAGPLAASADQRYFAGIVDLPLMPGLREVPEAGIVFDKPQGRIVEAEARGAVAPAAVRRYYAEALPPLGWAAAGADSWRRAGEMLTLRVRDGSRSTAVRFSLAPD